MPARAGHALVEAGDAVGVYVWLKVVGLVVRVVQLAALASERASVHAAHRTRRRMAAAGGRFLPPATVSVSAARKGPREVIVMLAVTLALCSLVRPTVLPDLRVAKAEVGARAVASAFAVSLAPAIAFAEEVAQSSDELEYGRCEPLGGRAGPRPRAARVARAHARACKVRAPAKM